MFRPLNCTADGVGPYRMNRFRVYFRPVSAEQEARGFRHNEPIERIAQRLATDLQANFPSYFNPNLATVSVRSEQYANRPTWRFLLSAGLFGSEHPIAQNAVPDIHADWVGMHRVHSNGFTAQTLKREFCSDLDWAAYGITTVSTAGAGAALTSLTGPGAIAGAAIGGLSGLMLAGPAAMYINQHHFLAGRRSWVIAPKAAFGRVGVANYDAIPDDALVLETAAVERLSHFVFRLANWTKVLGSFDQSIQAVWIRLLNNYIARQGFQTLPVKVWSHQSGDISFDEPAHQSDEKACKSSHAYGSITTLHQGMLD